MRRKLVLAPSHCLCVHVHSCGTFGALLSQSPSGFRRAATEMAEDAEGETEAVWIVRAAQDSDSETYDYRRRVVFSGAGCPELCVAGLGKSHWLAEY